MATPPYMPQTPDQMMHAIQALTGEVHALLMFSHAVAQAHPNPQALLINLQTAEQHGLADLKAQTVNEAVLGAFQDTMGTIRKLLEDRDAFPQFVGA